MGKRIEIIAGTKVGGLLFINEAEPRIKAGKLRRYWNVRCYCGNTFEAQPNQILSGNTRSCGCLKREASAENGRKGAITIPRSIKHGFGRRDDTAPEYIAWKAMKQRCYYEKADNYSYYGGRGIRVCDEWLNDFQAFYDYVGPRPSSEHSLDRYPNNDGNYEPGNVRWATKSEQTYNQRKRNPSRFANLEYARRFSACKPVRDLLK